jgi:hypothetical protein
MHGVRVLQQGPAAAAAELGRAAISLLDAQERVVPWRLLSETARAASTSGEGAAADILLERGTAALEEQRKSGMPVEPVAAGFLIYEKAQRLVIRGKLDEAQSPFEEATRFAAQAGNEVNAAIVRGRIAGILNISSTSVSVSDLSHTYRSIRRKKSLSV